MLFLALGLFVVVSILVILVRKGTTGRYLDALRGSETAATVDRHQSRPGRAIVAFAFSAGIAGLGGGLLAIQENQANYAANYSVLFGLSGS